MTPFGKDILSNSSCFNFPFESYNKERKSNMLSKIDIQFPFLKVGAKTFFSEK